MNTNEKRLQELKHKLVSKPELTAHILTIFNDLTERGVHSFTKIDEVVDTLTKKQLKELKYSLQNLFDLVVSGAKSTKRYAVINRKLHVEEEGVRLIREKERQTIETLRKLDKETQGAQIRKLKEEQETLKRMEKNKFTDMGEMLKVKRHNDEVIKQRLKDNRDYIEQSQLKTKELQEYVERLYQKNEKLAQEMAELTKSNMDLIEKENRRQINFEAFESKGIKTDKEAKLHWLDKNWRPRFRRYEHPKQFSENVSLYVATNNQIDGWMKDEVVEEVEAKDKHKVKMLNPFAAAMKKSMEWRICMDSSRWQNLFCMSSYVLINGTRECIVQLNQNDYGVVVDLKDGFLSLKVNEKDSWYLCFEWEGKIYRFKKLIWGPSSTPYEFTKFTSYARQMMWRAGIRHAVQVDDFLILGETEEKTLENLAVFISICNEAGIEINFKKSNLIPSQRFLYSGRTYNTQTMSVEISDEKIKMLNDKLDRFKERGVVMREDIESIVSDIRFYGGMSRKINEKLRLLTNRTIGKKRRIENILIDDAVKAEIEEIRDILESEKYNVFDIRQNEDFLMRDFAQEGKIAGNIRKTLKRMERAQKEEDCGSSIKEMLEQRPPMLIPNPEEKEVQEISYLDAVKIAEKSTTRTYNIIHNIQANERKQWYDKLMRKPNV